MFDVIAFDADDTLWLSEILYVQVQEKLISLLSPYVVGELVKEHLYKKEMDNLDAYGYGVKSFVLSMIETSIELTQGRITAPEIQRIAGFAKEMLSDDIQLLDHVKETVRALAQSYPLMVITKGDLLDQETKLARSGIGDFFQSVEVVSSKTTMSYEVLLQHHKIDPQRFLMVGNSLKSDILPVLEIGGNAVYIPNQTTWAHELVDNPPVGDYHELANIGQVPALLVRLG